MAKATGLRTLEIFARLLLFKNNERIHSICAPWLKRVVSIQQPESSGGGFGPPIRRCIRKLQQKCGCY